VVLNIFLRSLLLGSVWSFFPSRVSGPVHPYTPLSVFAWLGYYASSSGAQVPVEILDLVIPRNPLPIPATWTLIRHLNRTPRGGGVIFGVTRFCHCLPTDCDPSPYLLYNRSRSCVSGPQRCQRFPPPFPLLFFFLFFLLVFSPARFARPQHTGLGHRSWRRRGPCTCWR